MRRRTFIALLAAGPAVAACTPPSHATIRGLTMGTSYSVELAVPLGDRDRADLVKLIEAELSAISRAMSTFDPRSELSAFNLRDERVWVPVSRGLLEVLESAARISTSTQGAFDVTVGPLVDLWGFGSQYRPQRVPSDDLIAQARESVGYRNVQIDPSAGAIRKMRSHTRIDLNAIAPGYGVDRIAMILESQGFGDYLVEIGGEFRARGATAAGRSWRVGIERPAEGHREIGEIVVLKNRAIATSGTTKDFFDQDGRRYSHSIDPATGRPVEHRPMAVSVVSDTAMAADGWATALLVLGPDRGYALAQACGLAAILVTGSGSAFDVRVTDALRGHLLG